MERWYPPAIRDPFPDAGPFIDDVPWRGVLHTTEGNDYDGAKAVYKRRNVAPHFTIEWETDPGTAEGTGFLVRQHMPIDRAARALENLSGGVETNRARAIQIEVVASAAEPHWPFELVAGLRLLMMWIEAQTGIKPWAPPFIGAGAYGLKAVARMGPMTWKRFDGWCGHQHVPENEHWDPGAIDPIMAVLLAREEPDMPELRLSYPPKLILVRPQGDGYWIVAYDGGVFAFGNAPADLTAIGGGAVEKIIAGDVWPDGEGLLLMGEDGGVFALGSARYVDRVFFG